MVTSINLKEWVAEKFGKKVAKKLTDEEATGLAILPEGSEDDEEEEDEEEDDDDEEEEEEKPKKKRKRAVEEDEEEEEEEEEEDEDELSEEEILAMSKKELIELIDEHELDIDPKDFKSSKGLAKAIIAEVTDEEEDEDEEEEEEEKPKKKSSKKASSKKKKKEEEEDEEEDEDDEEEDEEEVAPTKGDDVLFKPKGFKRRIRGTVTKISKGILTVKGKNGETYTIKISEATVAE